MQNHHRSSSQVLIPPRSLGLGHSTQHSTQHSPAHAPAAHQQTGNKWWRFQLKTKLAYPEREVEMKRTVPLNALHAGIPPWEKINDFGAVNGHF